MEGCFHGSTNIRDEELSFFSHHGCAVVHHARHKLIRADGFDNHHFLEHIELIIGSWECLHPRASTITDSLPFMMILHEVLTDPLKHLYVVQSHQLMITLVPDIVRHP